MGNYAYLNTDGILKRWKEAQMYLDNRVIMDSERFVPIRSGTLRGSALIGTVIGSGEVVYAVPYAHYMYEGLDMVQEGTENRHFAEAHSRKVYNGKSLTYEQGGDKWFEEAKKVHGSEWIREVAKRM